MARNDNALISIAHQIGQLDGKLDGLVAGQSRIESTLDEHGGRIDSLESDRDQAAGAASDADRRAKRWRLAAAIATCTAAAIAAANLALGHL